MKKLFVVLVIIGSLFTSCIKYTITRERRESYDVEDFINLDILTSNSIKSIYVDKNTDVLYVYFSSGISPIMKADGTCLTLTEWKVNHDIKE